MNKIWLLLGPSGTGKTTLIKTLGLRRVLNEVVSYTTRTQRPFEEASNVYNFVSKPEFERMIQDKLLAEYVQFSGNYYGISKGSIEEKLKEGHVGIVVEPHGAEQIKALYGELVSTIFVSPPPESELLRRFGSRFGEDGLKHLQDRAEGDRMILEYRDKCDYILEPDFIESWVKQLKGLING